MNESVLAQLTRGTFVFVALLSVFDYLRHRDENRLDIALMFLSLATTILIQEGSRLLGLQLRWLSTLGTVSVVAHPFLLLRLVRHFQPVPRGVLAAAAAGMAASWVIVLLWQSPFPPVPTLIVVAYFVLIEGYAAVSFVRRARATGGVMRQRLRLVGTATGLLASVILLAGVNAAAPASTVLTAGISNVLAALSALAYYLGFGTPVTLRRAWQVAELHEYLRKQSGRSAEERVTQMLSELCTAAKEVTGGFASLVLVAAPDQDQFEVRASDGIRTDDSTFPVDRGVLGRVWKERRPQAAARGTDEELLRRFNAQGLYAVPLVSRDRAWGLLAVLLWRRSLFPTDDLEMLTLMAEQGAIVQENAELFSQQRRLIDELEATNRELEAFTYSVSHDLRAPLRSIDGFSQAVLEDYAGKLDGEGVSYLQRVRAASQRMGQLIDDLLQLSRITRAEIRREPVDLSAMVHDITGSLTRTHAGRQIAVRVADGVVTDGDPRLLRVALENLLSNAFKFTSKHAQATVEFGVTERDGRRVCFVRDDGAGFDMAHSHKLFGAFQRLHGQAEFEGTGVGLATVQRIIRRHGGQIWAEGAVEQGATFYFTVEPASDPIRRSGAHGQ